VSVLRRLVHLLHPLAALFSQASTTVAAAFATRSMYRLVQHRLVYKRILCGVEHRLCKNALMQTNRPISQSAFLGLRNHSSAVSSNENQSMAAADGDNVVVHVEHASSEMKESRKLITV
jgi:hypothetical protein